MDKFAKSSELDFVAQQLPLKANISDISTPVNVLFGDPNLSGFNYTNLLFRNQTVTILYKNPTTEVRATATFNSSGVLRFPVTPVAGFNSTIISTIGANATTKLPLYSSIKGESIFPGVQFVDNEYDNVAYLVLGELPPGQLPRDYVGTKVVPISQQGTTYNVTKEKPLGEGLYYTPASARGIVPVYFRSSGKIITYQTAVDTWVVEQYVFSNTTAWNTDSKWVRLLDAVSLAVVLELDRGLRSLNSANLYNKFSNKTGFTLSNLTGDSVVSSTRYHSNYVSITPSKRYILSGFQNGAPSVVRSFVFYDRFGKIINPNWSIEKPFDLGSVDGDTYPNTRSFYILEPLATIPADWKTNGLGILPIPLEAVFIRFNTGTTTYDWRGFFKFEESIDVVPSAYESFGVKSENIVRTAQEVASDLRNKSIQNELYNTNLFDITKRNISKYLKSTNAALAVQGVIDGKSFAVSDFINVAGGKIYYLANRASQNTENPDTRAIVFYDINGNALKPINSLGVEYPTFSIPYLNGKIYTPMNAVQVRFNCLYYSILENVLQIMFLTDNKQSASFIPFGSYLRKSLVSDNSLVLDGQVMLKNGDTFTGVNLEDIATSGMVVDEFYALKEYIAGARAKYANYELEYSNVLPYNGFAMTPSGVLVFMKQGIKYTVNLTLA